MTQRILFIFFSNYHLFNYLPDLINISKKNKMYVSVLTNNKELKQKLNCKVFNVPLIKQISSLFNFRYTRPLGWTIFRVLSYFITKNYDLVVLPRDDTPFLFSMSFWKPTLVITPGLSNWEKLYLQYKFSKNSKFPKISNYRINNSTSPYADKILGGGFLMNDKINKNLNYTVTGKTFIDYYRRIGIDKSKIYVVGNPNYENISKCKKKKVIIQNLKIANKNTKFFCFFSSQITFSKSEINKIFYYVNSIFYVFKNSYLIWKLHPKVNKSTINQILQRIKLNEFNKIKLLYKYTDEVYNSELISICKFVLIEDTNVGILACIKNKPIIIIDIADSKLRVLEQERDVFFKLFPGILKAKKSNIKNIIRNIEKDSFSKKIIGKQNEMLDIICTRNKSPCEIIVKSFNNIIKNNER